ncbi:hypothetical protein NA57DRAFT_81484 [Rhizodiscina lignyota]|uniref:Restriction of telomere capping protein 4 n=1 Tax=Rhizodiscina lignyota TaxID=1504668 RepID=A0A9P4I568_9PEZI|nr:hypothetical protein NA57DRAFT_81484 [Rhizodiscina lignyota]
MVMQHAPRQGLKRNGARLLKQVGGKPHARPEDHEPDAPTTSKTSTISVREPENIDDDPLSSDDERLSGELKPEFGSPTDNTAVSSTTSVDTANTMPKGSRGASKRKSKESKDIYLSTDARENGLAKGSEPVAMDGAQDSEEPQWMKDTNRKRKRVAKNTYRTSDKNADNFHNLPQKKSQPKSSRQAGKKEEATKFRIPQKLYADKDANSVASSNTQSDSGYRAPPPLLAPSKVLHTDSTAQPQRRNLRSAPPLSTISQPAAAFRTVKSIPAVEASKLSAFSTDFKHYPGLESASTDETTDPILYSSQVSANASNVLSGSQDLESESESLSSALDLSDVDEEAEDEESSDITNCPYCEAPVSRSALYDFDPKYSRNKRMKIGQQAQFCRSHRRADAQLEWDKRAYPTIEWAELPSRITLLYDHVLDIIEQKRDCVFLKTLEEKIDSGRHRNLAQSMLTDDTALDALVPGYYGGRGAKIMAECLTSSFGSKLRERAGREDKYIAAAGVSGFVQAVLVPEVGARLVMEDLGVNEDRAVEVLKEAAELGDLLHDGEDEEGGRW